MRNGLGETLTAGRQAEMARPQHTATLALAVATGDRREEARAHAGLGDAAQALDEPETARRHWRLALALFTELDLPQACAVRERLASLDVAVELSLLDGA